LGYINRLDCDYIVDCNEEIKRFLKRVWINFFKKRIDEQLNRSVIYIDFLRKFFFSCEWYEVYDFIEFLPHNFSIGIKDPSNNLFIKKINKTLEKELSAYRFVNGLITQTTSEYEIETIEDAINSGKQFKGVEIHLNKALELLSDRRNPDYRNSIKESISAGESTCRVLTNESTLGKALKKLEIRGIYINPQLKNGFEKIYAYTNSKESGIRHAIVIQPIKPDFEDAKYMLISCSSFINYLIGKSQKMGIKLE